MTRISRVNPCCRELGLICVTLADKKAKGQSELTGSKQEDRGTRDTQDLKTCCLY